MTISIIGSTGLVGSRVTELLKGKYEIEELNSSSGFDISDKDSVSSLNDSISEVVILLAAKTNVDDCEEDKKNKENSEAWKVNVDGVRNVAEVCASSGKKLIYVSTDYVFNGNLSLGEKYTEDDTPSPINWYGVTKYEGEKIVKALTTPWLIARTSSPYRPNFDTKSDFVRTFLRLIKEDKEISVVEDQIMTPTFIDDIASALDVLLNKMQQAYFI